MKFNPEIYKRERWRFILLISVFWFFALILIKDAFKTKADFKVITGRVIEVGNTEMKGFRGAISYVYYFGLSNHNQLLGVGTDENRIPILDNTFKGVNVGDSIKVTFEENWATKNEPVNQVVHEIVRNNRVLYDNIPRSFWNGRMKTGLICFIIGIFFLFTNLFFNKKYNRLKKN